MSSWPCTPVIVALFALVMAEYVVPRSGPPLRAASAGRSSWRHTMAQRFAAATLALLISVPASSGTVSLQLVAWLAMMGAGSAVLGLLKEPLYGEAVPTPGRALWCLAAYLVGHALLLTAFSWRWGPLLGPASLDLLAWLAPAHNPVVLAPIVNRSLLIGAGYAYVARGGAEIVRAVLDTLNIGGDEVGQTRVRIGQTVGYLERFLLLAFILLGEYGAIGFVLAAKSIARYQGISESREFAEYYLVGTLSSAAVAIAVSLLISGVPG